MPSSTDEAIARAFGTVESNGTTTVKDDPIARAFGKIDGYPVGTGTNKPVSEVSESQKSYTRFYNDTSVKADEFLPGWRRQLGDAVAERLKQSADFQKLSLEEKQRAFQSELVKSLPKELTEVVPRKDWQKPYAGQKYTPEQIQETISSFPQDFRTGSAASGGGEFLTGIGRAAGEIGANLPIVGRNVRQTMNELGGGSVNPDASVSNTVGSNVGSMVPVAVGQIVGVPASVSMAAQGRGSALNEQPVTGASDAETQVKGAERAAFGFVLGKFFKTNQKGVIDALAGKASATELLKTFLTGAVVSRITGLTQTATETLIDKAVGKDESVAEELLKNLGSGNQAAADIIFGLMHTGFSRGKPTSQLQGKTQETAPPSMSHEQLVKASEDALPTTVEQLANKLIRDGGHNDKGDPNLSPMDALRIAKIRMRDYGEGVVPGLKEDLEQEQLKKEANHYYDNLHESIPNVNFPKTQSAQEIVDAAFNPDRQQQTESAIERAFSNEAESQLSHLRESTIPEGFVESLLPKEEIAPVTIKEETPAVIEPAPVKLSEAPPEPTTNQPKESLPSEKQDEPTSSSRPSAEALKDLQALHEEHQRILENDNLSPQERETRLDEIQKEQIFAVRDLTGIKDPTPREVVDAIRNTEIEQLKSQSTPVPTTANVEQSPIKLPSKTQNELETLQAQHRAIAEMSRTAESDSPEVSKWLSDAADRIDSLKRQISLEAPAKQSRLDSHKGGFVQLPKILESLVERGLATGKWTLDHTIAAAHWLSSKSSDLVEATKQLVTRFGEAIKPHVDKIVSLAKEHIAAAQKNSIGAVGDVGKVRMARISETAKDVATAIRIEHGDKPEPESAIRKGFAKLTGDDLANTPHKGVVGETIERLKDIKTFVSDSMAGHPEMKKVFVEDAISSTSEQKSDFNRMTEEWKKIASEQGLKPKQIARMETETQRVTAGGQSLRLTRMQIAMVTAAVQRASNLKAMIDGGLVIEGREGPGQVIKDPAMINAIIAAGGPAEKALAEGSVKRVYPLVTEKLVKVKGEESGKPLRLEEGYSPRSTSDEGVQKGLNEKMKSEGVKGDQEYIEGMNKAHQQLADDLSIVQPAGKTGQPFVIRSLNKVVQEFIQKASIYGNKTQATREMLLYRGNPELREALRFSAGENALHYLDRYISDASGLFNREGDAAIKRVVGKLRSNYASTILFAKVSSAVKHYVGNSMNVATQFSGQDLMDYVKGVAKASAGIGNAEYKSRISEDMGTLHERIVGRGSDLLTAPLEGERAIVRATSVGRGLEKVRDFGGKPFKLADFPAIRGAMEANEGAVTREGKLEKGSPEFEKEVIRRTTINIESAANPITKEGQADLYRSLNKTPLSLATVFKSPAMKTLNLVMQEVGNFRRAESSAEKSQALRNLAIIATGRLLTSAIGVGTSAAVVSLAVKASRGGVQQKDKDRVLRTALLEAVREVGGSVPIVSDLLDEIVSRSAGLKGTTSQGPIGQISDVAGGIGDLIHELTVSSKSESGYTKASEEEHSKKLMSAFDKLLPALTNTLGIPFSSVYLDTKKVVKPLSKKTTAQEWAEKIRQKDPEVKSQLTKMVNEGKLSREGLKKIYERAGMGDQKFDLREAGVEEALTMWKGSSKEERKGMASEVFAKVRSSSKIPAEEKRSLFTRLRVEMN